MVLDKPQRGAADPPEPNYVQGEVLVKFKEGADPQAVLNGVGIEAKSVLRIHSIKPSVARFKKTQNLKKDEEGWYWFFGKKYNDIVNIPDEAVFKQAYESMSPPEKALYRTYKIILPDGASVKEMMEQLNKNPAVEYAEPNYRVRLDMVPNDSYYHSTGAWGQTYDDLWGIKKINCERAWNLDLSQGAGVVVAVIDTGVDYTHPDLTANIWVNPGEVRDINNDGVVDINDIDINHNGALESSEISAVMDRIDNGHDNPQGIGNGYTDDIFGYNFFDNTADPMDEHGHGTHVAGTIAAVGNNNIGVIGVAPRARIMCLRALWGRRIYTLDDVVSVVVEAIIYAAFNGADVSNNSWGISGTSQTLKDAFRYANMRDPNEPDKKPMLSIASAGNDDIDSRYKSPANIDEVLTVAATTQNDEKCYFTNYGCGIEVSAPGGGNSIEGLVRDPVYNILSTAPDNSEIAKRGIFGVASGYYRLAGTSMAGPHAAGVAALVKSRYPSDPPEIIRARIMAGCDNIDNLNSRYAGFLGAGRLNAENALLVTPSPLLKATKIEFNDMAKGREGQIITFVKNFWTDIRGITATLTCANPNVTVRNSAAFLGDIFREETKENSEDPFRVFVAETLGDDEIVNFNLTLTNTSGYQKTIPFNWKPAIFELAPNSGLPDVMEYPVFTFLRDFNDDGYSDALLVSWGFSGITNLYRSNADSTFTELPLFDSIMYQGAPLLFDMDNDGDQDLFIHDEVNDYIRVGLNLLFMNDGDGAFTDITDGSGINPPDIERTNMAAAIDYNNDSLVDIITNQGLFRNNGDRAFTLLTQAQTGLPVYNGNFDFLDVDALRILPIGVFDYNNDGYQDILSTNTITLYRNNGDGTFTDVNAEAHVRTAPPSLPHTAVATGDYNNDGYIDLYINYPEGNGTLYRNNGTGTFTDATLEAGLDGHGSFAISLGTAFFDYDNDGNLDLYLSDGIKPELLRNNGDGTFTDVSDTIFPDGVNVTYSPASFGDYNNDGALDMYAPGFGIFIGGGAGLFKNNIGVKNNWIRIKLQGTRSNRDAYGAKVFVRTGNIRQLREVHTSPVETQPIHFGLGLATRIDEIEIHWPSGLLQFVTNVDANQLLTIVEENNSPILTPINDREVIAGQTLTLNLHATDPNLDPLTYYAYQGGDLNHDGWATFVDSRILFGLIPSQEGLSHWNPEADLNNDGWIVNTDYMILTNTIGLNRQKPAGINLDSQTGAFSWTPTVSQQGDHYLTFVASDGELTDALTVKITVLGPPFDPTNLSALAISSNRIDLIWWDNSNNEDGFKIERSLSASSGFSQIATVGANVITYSNTGLIAGTTYYYRVRAYNNIGNSGYSNTTSATTKSVIFGIWPTSGVVGTYVDINGQGFGSRNSSSRVNLSGPTGSADAQIVQWSNAWIRCRIPQLPVGAYALKAITASGDSNSVTFTIPAPRINSISPTSARPGVTITIHGNNFGPSNPLNRVSFNGLGGSANAQIVYWANWFIRCNVPQLPAGSYNVKVINSSGESNSVGFTVRS